MIAAAVQTGGGRARPLLLHFSLAAGLVLAGAPAAAGDASAGRAKAQACAVCHGPLGISVRPDAPNLAGQPAIYIAAQLRAFRSGRRGSETMGVVAKPLSDADIDNLAAWFASIEVSAKEPGR